MSGGSQPSRQQVITTQSNSGPWPGQEPYLRDGFQIARETLASRAANEGYYPGETYMRPTQWTGTGLNSMLSRAENGGTANALPGERALASNAYGLLSGGATQTPGYSVLASTANGNMIGRNPEFQGMVNRSMEAIRPGIDSQFAGAGRLGSGAHAAAMASAGANMAGNLAYGDYQQERGNQLNAAGQLIDANMQARQLGAGMLGQASANDRQNVSDMLSGGQIVEDYGQRGIDAEIARWNYNQNLPWDQIGKYMSLIQGNYGGSGTTQEIKPIYGNAGLSTGISGVAGLGQLATGLGSLGLHFSDARLKEDIRRVGETDDGLGIYAYRYKGSPTTEIGLLAQEVAMTKPEAVANVGGLLAVNYDTATS